MGRLVFEEADHFVDVEIIVAQHDVDLVQEHQLVVRIVDHFLGPLPRGGCRRDIPGPVLGFPGEPLPHGGHGHEIGEPFEDGALSGFPLSLHELDDADFHTVTDTSGDDTHGGRGLALALARMDHQQAAFLGLGGEDFVLGFLVLAPFFIGARVDFVFGQLFGHPPLSSLISANSAAAVLDRGCQSPRPIASSNRSAISLKADGLLSSINDRTRPSRK